MRRVLYLLLLGAAILPSSLRAQSTAAYAVTYFQVMPSSKAAAVTALKQYRDTSRKDEGYVSIDLFEQVGMPGHLALLETWNEQKALDAHSAAAHTKQLLSKLQPIRLSEYDQRPYKSMAAGPAPAGANDRTIYVLTHVDIAGPPGEGPGLLRRLAETSRKEEGNLRFDVLQHAMRANHFTIVEAWQSQKALDAHAAAAHTKEHRDAMHPMLGSPRDERLYKVVE
ncbi:MAG TPA: antibiotic biosynthesis monooxygenase [Terriglobia bacterium]|nr:antibiotic biosynthesis monooxygenase [Terriglobia bacterium]